MEVGGSGEELGGVGGEETESKLYEKSIFYKRKIRIYTPYGLKMC